MRKKKYTLIVMAMGFQVGQAFETYDKNIARQQYFRLDNDNVAVLLFVNDERIKFGKVNKTLGVTIGKKDV